MGPLFGSVCGSPQVCSTVTPLFAGTDFSGVKSGPAKNQRGTGWKPLPRVLQVWGWHALCYPLGTLFRTYCLRRELVAFQFRRDLSHCDSSYSTVPETHAGVPQPSKSCREWKSSFCGWGPCGTSVRQALVSYAKVGVKTGRYL